MFASRRGAAVGALLYTLVFPAPARAQGERHEMPGQIPMLSGALGISMDRMGSGTTWIPDAVTLPSRHTKAGAWDVLFHGFAFGQYDRQSGPRGDEQLGSLNWMMLMASRSVAGGLLQARTMLSLDPLTVTNRGYPLLLQVGETYNGVLIRDRQHPHDFWMELGVLYERAVTERVALSLYAAPSGEPALGPVAFMHRPSAMDDPVAPLGHHWQDATHISAGVLTAGVFTRTLKLEGSVFNGREPDEKRFEMDRIKLDSYSGRVTLNPNAAWSASVGYGFLKSPETLSPGESMHRVTASLLNGRKLGSDGQWATTLVWGANAHDGEWSHAALVETEAILDHHNSVLGRVDVAQRTAAALALPATIAPDATYNVASVSLGYIRELTRWLGATTGVGIRVTVNFVPSALETTYGSGNPTGLMVFLRVRPFHRAMSDMQMND